MSLPLTSRAVDRVLVALKAETVTASAQGAASAADSAPVERTVQAAEVLASWFGASLQFVTTDDTAIDQLEHLSGTIGLRTDPVLVLSDEGFDQDLSTHASQHAPTLVVASASPSSLAFASQSSQPTYLIPSGPKRRQPSGPMLVDLTSGTGRDDAVALATVWAQALGISLALLVDHDPTTQSTATQLKERLESMGLTVELLTDAAEAERRFSSDDATPLALVVAGTATSADFVTRVLAADGRLLVAPSPATPHHRVADIDLNAVHDLAAALGNTSDDADGLSHAECVEVLAQATIGRIGYIDHGWPIVVPVNFSTYQNDVFIRSVRGGKLSAAVHNDRVCFEVDTFSESEHRGRSVVIHGHLEVINDPATLQAAWANDPAPWIEDDQLLWLRLATLATTGRQVGGNPAGAVHQG